MSDVVEFELHGAKVSIPAAQLISHWLDKAGLPSNLLRQSPVTPPRLGTIWVGEGGVYAGIVRGQDGAPDYHLVHATDEHELTSVNWRQAVDRTAARIEGFIDWSLPDRREARLLYINSPDSFNTDGWYWTSTQDAADPDYAWMQDFSDGYQDGSHKSNEYRARAVRRILIIE